MSQHGHLSCQHRLKRKWQSSKFYPGSFWARKTNDHRVSEKIIKELTQLQIHKHDLTHELTRINGTHSKLLQELDTNAKQETTWQELALSQVLTKMLSISDKVNYSKVAKKISPHHQEGTMTKLPVYLTIQPCSGGALVHQQTQFDTNPWKQIRLMPPIRNPDSQKRG